MVITFFSNEINKLKIGNGTSLLVFANILSTVPIFFKTIFHETVAKDIKKIFILFILMLFIILGIVFVQDAERKISVNYASQYSNTITKISKRTPYLPFKVNATGVMPIIFVSSFLTLSSNVSRFTNIELLQKFASSLSSNRPMYILYNVGMIYLFNYFYTFIQFKPNDV